MAVTVTGWLVGELNPLPCQNSTNLIAIQMNIPQNPQLHKNSVIRCLSIGQVVAVGIAHTYQKGYGWSDYSESNYIIEKISRKEIVGRNERYSHEGIRISREDLDSGRFELRL